jgi:hypothetical protein
MTDPASFDGFRQALAQVEQLTRELHDERASRAVEVAELRLELAELQDSIDPELTNAASLLQSMRAERDAAESQSKSLRLKLQETELSLKAQWNECYAKAGEIAKLSGGQDEREKEFLARIGKLSEENSQLYAKLRIRAIAKEHTGRYSAEEQRELDLLRVQNHELKCAVLSEQINRGEMPTPYAMLGAREERPKPALESDAPKRFIKSGAHPSGCQCWECL